MAEKKKKTNTKTQTSKKQTSTKKTAAKSNSKPETQAKEYARTDDEKKTRVQSLAVVLFCFALFLLALCIVPGGSAWGFLRNNVVFGTFGLCAFLWPFLMFYVSVVCSKDTIGEKGVKGQIFGIGTFIVTLSSIVHILANTEETLLNTSIWEQIKMSYKIGLAWKNGGLIGSFIGSGLAKLCDNKVAPICVLLIIAFMVVMLVTRTTLSMLKRVIDKPVKKVGEYTSEKIENRRNSRHAEEAETEEDNDFTPGDNDFTPDDVVEKYVPQGSPRRSRKEEEIKPIEVDKSRDNEDFDEIELIMPPPISPRNRAVGRNLERKSHSYSSSPYDFKPIEIEKSREFMNFEEEKPAEKKAAKKPVKVRQNIKKETEKDSTLNPFEASETSYIKSKSGKSVLYKYPPLNCLRMGSGDSNVDYTDELKAYGTRLVNTLRSFGVETKIIGISRGPSVTRFEIQPAPGVKISKITNLADDIAMNMAATGVRIEAPIPGKAAVGIEIPNKSRSMVSAREIIDSDTYRKTSSKLNVALGKDITGNIICVDIAKMPHLLIAGTTGSGKSVCLNSMIVSLLYNSTPDEVKLLMIDPKQVEFTVYNGIPHLLVPVVSDPRKAAGALSWAVTEMLNRYKLFSERNVRDIKGYNKFCDANPDIPKMPQIVIFIDELSDLMMAAPNEVEDSICRLAQMARAAGMHLVIATQRPSVNVITGVIKANIPSRISLSVSSQVDSRTIIDTAGAEKLLGNGDMLYSPVGMSKPLRVQGAFLSDEEVENVVDYIKNQASEQQYDEDIIEKIENHTIIEKKKAGFEVEEDDSEVDPMLASAIEVVVEAQMASTTLLQKKLKLGYARASRMIDELEERGIVGPFQGSKPRNVLLTKQQYLEMMALSENGAIDMRSSDGEIAEFDDEEEEYDF